MDYASGKIELSECYIKKLNCGHKLQRHDAVVLYRNNGIRTPSVTAAINCDSAILVYIPLVYFQRQVFRLSINIAHGLSFQYVTSMIHFLSIHDTYMMHSLEA